MRLVQLNMWWGGKLDKSIQTFLEEVNPDIICLQEAVSSKLTDAGLFLSIEQLQKLGFPHKEFAPAFTFNLMRGAVSFGNAILSRLPIEESFSFYTNLGHIEDFDFNIHDYNVRNLLHCAYKINGSKINILTHHGHHVHEHKDGNQETLRQMEQIKEYIDGLPGAVILTGDFNLAPHSKSLDKLNKSLINLSVESGLKTTRTMFSLKDEVCDYIFVNDSVKVDKFYASEEIVSDHKALVLEFDL
ncbi:MAG: hypothetical protein JWO96_445 [Candidatus Saccharibacteria bacterium]|nr:hypothetical protein [Candidatus Saccharibacteria bacterium]